MTKVKRINPHARIASLDVGRHFVGMGLSDKEFLTGKAFKTYMIDGKFEKPDEKDLSRVYS
jgi:hypothetical protein